LFASVHVVAKNESADAHPVVETRRAIMIETDASGHAREKKSSAHVTSGGAIGTKCTVYDVRM
jgi:hypothetical protein